MTVDSYEELFRESFPRLVALGTMMSGDADLARDLAQETMLRAHRRWDEVRGYDHPGAWLRRVMSNLLIDHHRSRVAEGAAIQRVGVPSDAVDDLRDAESAWADLMRCLTPEQRVIATLFYGDDASVESIASTLEMSTGAVKSALFKIRKRLRERRAEVGHA